MKMKITVNHLTKKLKGNIVSDDISLEMISGNVYGLCGYNGCGKTMLMRLLAGLIIPTGGEILYDQKRLGKDMNFPPNMGILIENPAFIDGKSGEDNLILLSSIGARITKDEVRSAIERVGLNPDDKRKYKKYSLGMKQRLGIAAAIMEKPEVIILDEPTNALDKDGIELVKSIIMEEKDRGALIIMSCHDYSILENCCDCIYKIERGKITDTMYKNRSIE